MLCLQQYLADLLIGVLQVEPLDLRPGCHEGIHTAFVESQHALQHVLFGLFENAQFCALVNEHLDLLGGHVRNVRWFDAEKLESTFSRDAQEPDQRPEQ